MTWLQARQPMIHCLIPGSGKRILCPWCPEWLWGPPTPLSNRYWSGGIHWL